MKVNRKKAIAFGFLTFSVLLISAGFITHLLPAFRAAGYVIGMIAGDLTVKPGVYVRMPFGEFMISALLFAFGSVYLLAERQMWVAASSALVGFFLTFVTCDLVRSLQYSKEPLTEIVRLLYFAPKLGLAVVSIMFIIPAMFTYVHFWRWGSAKVSQ